MLLRDKDHKEIVRLANESFTKPVKIWAYGSRVNGMAHAEPEKLDVMITLIESLLNEHLMGWLRLLRKHLWV